MASLWQLTLNLVRAILCLFIVTQERYILLILEFRFEHPIGSQLVACTTVLSSRCIQLTKQHLNKLAANSELGKGYSVFVHSYPGEVYTAHIGISF